jgi:putative DNA primase/helicase
VLNCLSGVVKLRTGKRIDHAPEQRLTMQCPVVYDPEAEAPHWEAFLRQVQPDPEVRAYLRRQAGYCATAHTTEQAFFLWHGTGANGKSVAQEVIAGVLGTYAQSVPVETLLLRKTEGAIPNDIARMIGKRYLVASETKQGKHLDEQRLKQLTGGDTVSARFLHAEWFDFKPVGKINLSTNHLPHMTDDDATWRRLHVLLWGETIPEGKRDGTLVERLIREEGSGILNWIVQGAVEWFELAGEKHSEALRPPASVLAGKDAYRRDEDTVGRFMDECLIEVPAANGAPDRSATAIHQAFVIWAKDDLKMSQRALTESIKRHKDSNGNAFEYGKSGDWRGFPRLRVKQVLP